MAPAVTANPDSERSRLMTADDVAELLQVRRHYVYRLVRERRIPHLRLGERHIRFDRPALEALDRRAGGPMSALGRTQGGELVPVGASATDVASPGLAAYTELERGSEPMARARWSSASAAA